MRRRPPLTATQLAEIYDSEPSENVLALLHEIRRLRATVSRANQIRKMIGAGGHFAVPDLVWKVFENELDAEPCLTDSLTARQEEKSERSRQRLLREGGLRGKR